MTLREILPAVWRWWWVILALSSATTLVLALRLRPSYVAHVTLQISQPPSEQVLLFEQSAPFSNLRDELTIARNNFIETARSGEVRAQTVAALGLRDASRDYVLDVAEVRDSDFVSLSIETQTPGLSQAIANAHATIAIQRTAELRAMPAVAAKQLLSDQVSAASSALDAAERDAAGTNRNSTASQARVTQARADHMFWQKKLAEAEIKASNAYAASFMQVVVPAELPSQPSTQKVRAQVVMGAGGSFVMGVLLAIALDWLSGRLALRQPLVVRTSPLSRVAP
jgi:uncharacterized protein involved in exopolysaccharide biosynthesis